MSLGASLWILVTATSLSGAAALFHETLWARSFSIIFGSTIHAAAATFAAMLFGLALGARLAGGLVRGTRRVVEAYALVELAIAVSAGLAGHLLFEYRNTLPLFVGEGDGLGRMVRAFAMTLGMLVAPTVAMGATFPLVLEVSRSLGGPARTSVSRLYAFNTFGAAIGALACGFFALPSVGVRASIAIAVSMNLVSGLLVLVLRQKVGRVDQGPVEPVAETIVLSRVPGEKTLLVLAVLSGAAVLSLEVVWTRFASYVLGNRTFAFTTLLAWVLVLLAAGSALSSRLLARFGSNTERLLRWVLVACVASVLVSGPAVNWWIRQQFLLDALFSEHSALLVVLRVMMSGLLMAPLFVTFGLLFPLSLTCSRHCEQRVGHTAGRFYLWNTVGSVAGSLLTGFVAIAWVGAYGCLLLVAGIAAMVSLVLGLLHWRRTRSPGTLAFVGVCALLLTFGPFVIPERLMLLKPGEVPIARTEDEHGVFLVTRLPNGHLKVTNNRTELVYHLGAASTSYVQQMQGHLAMFYVPEAKTALVLGSGYGITAGALAAYPSLERIDAVEIIPAMVEAADRFEPFNLGYHRDPRVRLFVDDGRHFLARSREKWDIISINVSDPHLPGASSLFHTDFYDLVKEHLTPRGVVIQHAFGTDVKVVLSTLQHSFRHLALYAAYRNGFNVVASDHELVYDEERVTRLIETPSVREALRSIGHFPPLDPVRVYARPLKPRDLAHLFDETLIATDDRPLLEFSTRGDPSLVFFSNE